MKLALEAAGVGLWAWEPDIGKGHFSNDALRMCGFPQRQEVNTVALYRAVHPDDRQRLSDIIRNPATDTGKVEGKIRFIEKDGAPRWIYLSGASAPGLDKDCGRQYLGIAVDLANTQLADDLRGQDELKLADIMSRALRYRINPHFLFNMLNAIASLTFEDAAKAEEMIVKLSMFYRKSFSLEPSTLITLDEELELLEMYVEMEEVRFEEQLKIDFEISGDVRNALVPPLILQPILEESIKYGLQSSRKLTHVVLSAKACDDRLQLIIEDDGRASEATQAKPIVSSMDLARMRLEHAYAGQYQLGAQAKPDRGYAVRIEIPLRIAPEG